MKRFTSFLIMLVLMLGCFVICSDTPAYAAKKLWTTEYYKDKFGDATDEWYITNSAAISGTFNNATVNKGNMNAEILVDEGGVYIKLFEDGKTPVKNATLLPEGYIVSLKTAEGQTLDFEGVMYGEDDRIHVLDAADLVTALCGGDEIKIYVEKYLESTTNYLFSVKGSNFAAQLDSIKEVYYQNALTIAKSGRYEAAIAAFTPLIDYKDSAEQIVLCETAILDAAYDEAAALKEAGDYEEAITAFEDLDGYKDSAEQIKLCETAILDEAYDAAAALKEAGKYEEAIAAFEDLDGYRDSAEQIVLCETAILDAAYDAAAALKEAGKYVEAIAAFEALNGHKDSAEQIVLCETAILDAAYDEAEALAAEGKTAAAAIAFNHVGEYKDAQARSNELWKSIRESGPWQTVSAGTHHSVGLKADGTVVAVGNDDYGQCNIGDWTDIVAISAGAYYTVGLKADGTVVAVGNNDYGQCQVNGWADIVAISAGTGHTVSLKADGTVVAVGWNEYGQWRVSGWTDIVAVSAGGGHTVGLKADGTVVAVGYKGDGRCDVSDWTDIRVPGIQ